MRPETFQRLSDALEAVRRELEVALEAESSTGAVPIDAAPAAPTAPPDPAPPDPAPATPALPAPPPPELQRGPGLDKVVPA